jgi:hypothetical protein
VGVGTPDRKQKRPHGRGWLRSAQFEKCVFDLVSADFRVVFGGGVLEEFAVTAVGGCGPKVWRESRPPLVIVRYTGYNIVED